MMTSSGYADINGIRMYYEIYGAGDPLVLIHGGGSTIQSSFGRIIPLLQKHWKLICVELQAHGRTSDRDAPISFKQDAEDVYAVLRSLDIKRADIFGFSNGATTALQLAISRPEICNKIIAASPLLKRDGVLPQFWEFMKNGTFDQMPQGLKDAYLEVNPDPEGLMNMFRKCGERMVNFEDFPDEEIRSIQSPVLLLNGDMDVATSEHMVAMARLIPNAKLAIIPGVHGEYLGEVTTLKPGYRDEDFVVPMIENFLRPGKFASGAPWFFAPEIFIPNGVKELEFYQHALDAEIVRSWHNEDGTIHVAELSINGALFHVHEQKTSAGEISPAAASGTTVLLGLFVDDVDAVVERAVAAGAVLVSPPQSYDYGYRQAQIRDPFGHTWMIEKTIA